MEIIITDGTDPRFIALCRELDDYLNDIVGGEKQREQYNQYNTLEDIHDVMLITKDGKAVACGSFKEYDKDSAEVKRVFTKADDRGHGYGKQIMEEVEKRAREKGYKRLILETGDILKSAVHLYEKLGYRRIENYGQYKEIKESVCMEKKLLSF